ncbi:MAG: alanine--tRNA ligase, partial [Gemmataceae bacterium]|nr:alanine--tRNA ligase [Gemmataceae bacterium]
KHNDLDDVGKDTYHHTFFEMLGNWSFGDYFKKEAIAWAWELLTEVWRLDRSRLHVTVFEGDPEQQVPRDDEAAQHWRDVGVPETHIHLGSKKDNFWEMGDTGPCGPCTEIHYDKTPDKRGRTLVNRGSPEVIEIWNLVFIQFNRNPDQSLTPLPAKHVDTGMGFERITAVLQGKDSNYDTDLFAPLFEAIQRVTGASAYTGRLDDLKDTAYRVIADHIRTLTFAITDGAVPSNEKRGYVLRSILRRAERYGRQYLGATKPFLADLVPTLVERMGHVFPELRRDPGKVQAIIHAEEETFIRNFTRGVKLFQDVAETARKSGSNTISGKAAFDLHTTYGFFVDITEQMAAEIGLKVDRAEFQRLWQEFTEQSSKDRKKFVVTAVQGTLPTTDDSLKYETLRTPAQVLGWVQDNVVFSGGLVPHGRSVGLLLDRTCFYAEAGGQVGDSGVITSGTGQFIVETTQKLGDAVLHIGHLPEGLLEVGQFVEAQVDAARRQDIMRNHTATHLLNLALRQVLGQHVEQKGSLVDEQKTRFDFSHDKPLTPDEVAEIERRVNEQITADRPVIAMTLPLAQAKQIVGVRAVFGEKYPDPVRVVLIGPDNPAAVTWDDSAEFCGGTHLSRTSQAGLFKIISHEAVGKGVRRVTGVSGRAAFEAVQGMARILNQLAERLQCPPEQLLARVEALNDEVKKLHESRKKEQAGDLAAAVDRLLAEAAEVAGARIVIGELPTATMEQVRQQTDRIISKTGSCVVVLGWRDEGKAALRAVVTDNLSKRLHAGNLIKEVVAVVGGRGGGKPEKAEAGGPHADKLPEALELARQRVVEALRS